MAEPYVGEIRMFGGNFAPVGWAFCDGSLQSIAESETLFALIGTTYGGDGQSTFALPDLRGRVPLHQGNGFIIGESGGSETVTLIASQLPAHSHALNTAAPGTASTDPTGRLLTTASLPAYGEGTTRAMLPASFKAGVYGTQPHENMQPYQCISFIIALFGIFPTQS